MTTDIEKNLLTVRQLREQADWLEANADLGQHIPCRPLTAMTYNQDRLGEHARMVRAGGTNWKKHNTEYYTGVVLLTTSEAEIQFLAPHSTVCERKLVGTKEVQVEAVPAIPARAAKEAYTKLEEVYETVCPPLLELMKTEETV